VEGRLRRAARVIRPSLISCSSRLGRSTGMIRAMG
jgi:hypothetical protein